MLTTYIDGHQIVKRRYYWKYDNNKPAPNAHVLLNLAIGGSWAGRNGVDWNAFPQALKVAYVRVYQRAIQKKKVNDNPPALADQHDKGRTEGMGRKQELPQRRWLPTLL
jgi:hypothetical protein